MRILLKDGECEIPNEWIKAWDDLHYNVPKELMLALQWSADHAEKRKTRRGLRGFLGNWIRRKCPLRPAEKPRSLIVECVVAEPLEVRKENLAKLKEALR